MTEEGEIRLRLRVGVDEVMNLDRHDVQMMWSNSH
jgi:hypothetical protein